jgi:hypothetical protein
MSADTLSLDTLTDTLTDTVAASADALWLRHVTRARLAVLIAVGAPPNLLHCQRIGHRGKRPDYRGHPGVMIAVTDAELASQIEKQ